MMKKIEPSEIGKNPDLIASELNVYIFGCYDLFWYRPSSPPRLTLF